MSQSLKSNLRMAKIKFEKNHSNCENEIIIMCRARKDINIMKYMCGNLV